MRNIFKNKMWFLALLLVVAMTGCGGDDNGGGGGVDPVGSVCQGADCVSLGTAGNFVILSTAGITNVPTSVITGNVGTSPITGAAIGLTCAEVTGTIYSVDAAGPLPCRVTDATRLTTAVENMMTAYTDAEGRAPDFIGIGAGNISAMTLAPGVYKWTTGVSIDDRGVTLSGGPTDVWIFQIPENLTMASTARINLAGGALAKNIFWQVFGVMNVGTTGHFEGIALVQTAITMETGATANGRLLAQTAVALDANTIVRPAP